MKKLNNKGFAISVVIYGISVMSILIVSIMMSTMSNTIANTKELSNSIEEDLLNYSRVEVAFESGDDQEYTIGENQTGWYKVELWGAQGTLSNVGGFGAYTSGIIYLEQGTTLTLDVGTSPNYGAGNPTSIKYLGVPIMTAGGGGSARNADGGNLLGYNEGMQSIGGQINVASTSADFDLPAGETLIGTQSAYQSSVSSANSSTTGDATRGGASYISGYGGCAKASTGKYFVDGLMIAGVNQGNGHAKIERVVRKTSTDQQLAKKNAKLQNVRYIRDCLSDSTSKWNIYAMAEGTNIAPAGTISGKCKTVDLGNEKDLDEIAVMHDPGKDHIDHTIEVKGASGDWKYLKKKGNGTQLSETETPAGIHISAYQFDSSEKIPDSGNYYLLPVLSENKVVTAQEDPTFYTNPIYIDYVQSKKTQKWSIEKISNTNVSPPEKQPEYKIIELAGNKALSIQLDENKINNKISANTTFNNYARNEPQIWKVEAVGNGTYEIKTIVAVFDLGRTSGLILPQTNKNTPDGWNAENKSEIIIGKMQKKTQRFKIISIDYSSK